MTKFTSPQINELTEILTGAPVARAPNKAKAIARLESAAKAADMDPAILLHINFENAKQAVLERKDPLPESDMLARAAEIEPGTGGPGLARLRNHPDYKKITDQTIAEGEAAARGEDPFAKTKKPRAAKPAAAAPKPAKASRSKIQPDHMIDSVTDNPKRSGTKAHAIFACYKNGQTVAQFIKAVEKAGYTEADARSNLTWDRNKSFIRVSEAAA